MLCLLRKRVPTALPVLPKFMICRGLHWQSKWPPIPITNVDRALERFRGLRSGDSDGPKESTTIVCRDALKSFTDRVGESFLCALCLTSQMSFDL